MKVTFDSLPEAVGQLHEKMANIERLLLEQNNEPVVAEAEQFLTIQQAAEFLRLSVPTIYGLVHRSEIPVCKQGKRLYFSNKELAAWVKSGRKKTLSEIKSEANDYLSNQTKGRNYGK